MNARGADDARSNRYRAKCVGGQLPGVASGATRDCAADLYRVERTLQCPGGAAGTYADVGGTAPITPGEVPFDRQRVNASGVGIILAGNDGSTPLPQTVRIAGNRVANDVIDRERSDDSAHLEGPGILPGTALQIAANGEWS